MNRLIYRLLSCRFGANIEIRILMRRTAGAFGVDAPKGKGVSASKLLKRYARFTADAAKDALDSGKDVRMVHLALYYMACRLGKDLVRYLRPKNAQERLSILTLLYRNLGITIREEGPGEFCVSKCYFAAFYSPEVCDVISGIDQGIFVGILGGGTLTFHQRLTEGCKSCRANLIIRKP